VPRCAPRVLCRAVLCPRHAKLDEVAVLVAEAPIAMDYGPWKKMSPEGVDFLHACLDRDYHQRMTVRQVSGACCCCCGGG
jgi:hypothetical protein